MLNFKLLLITTLLCSSASLAQNNPSLYSPTLDPISKKNIASDLKLASSITFSKTSALHQKIFGPKGAYLAWFKKRIKIISFGSCMGSDTAVACVIPLFELNRMRITKRYVEMSAPQIARMSVLFHEAKHTEENPILKEGDPDLRYWLHAKCPTPFLDENNQERISIWTGATLSGLDGCDTVAEGAYGTVVIMLKNISLHSTNTTEKVKADAEIYGSDQLTRIIDQKAHDQLTNDLQN